MCRCVTPNSMHRRLLVTGGAGFIGANFVHYWMRRHRDDRVVVLDALTYAGNPANLDGVRDNTAFRFIHGDVCDAALLANVMAEERIDIIVHLAAESHVDRSIHSPGEFIRTNVSGTHQLLAAAREHWLERDDAPASHRFHHVSTDEVYGTLAAGDAPFSERTPYAPNSPYAASKAASDHLVRAYHHTYGLQVTTSNCSNNYGPFQFPEKLIPLMIVNCLGGRPLPIYGDGSNIRDWLYVEDHCTGIELVLTSGTVGETYNIGGNNEAANIDIVQRICHAIDSAFAAQPELKKSYPDAPPARGASCESLIKFVKDRPGHDWRYAIDASKATRELGYEPQHTFDAGLARTVSWMLENANWWRSVMDGSYREWLAKHYGEG